MVKEKKTYDIDPSDTASFVIFAKGAVFAKMHKTYIDVEGDKKRFYLVPTKPMRIELGLDETENADPSYDKVENQYIKEIPKEYLILLNEHPKFQKWFAFCDFNSLEFFDPFSIELGEARARLKIVEKERNNWKEKAGSLLRKNTKISRENAIEPEKVQEQTAKLINMAMTGQKTTGA